MSNSPSASDKATTAEAAGTQKGPLTTVFPPKQSVWREARRLVVDPNTRVENLAVAVIQDPVLVMELLRVANALYFAGGKSVITTPKAAIVRLGADVVLETLQDLEKREMPRDEDVCHWLEVHRSRCKRTGIVARILSEAIARNLSDDTQTAGCLVGIGDMLAVLHLERVYVKIAEEHSRSSTNYKLAQHHGFDCEKLGINYLRRVGIPEALLFAIDRDARVRNPERAVMKTLVMAAVELVDAFDTNRWEKLAPGKQLPPKSALRMLQLSEQQYLKIYERASEYLFSDRMLEERLKREAVQASADTAPAGDPAPGAEVPAPEPEIEVDTGVDQNALESEIENLLRSSQEIEPVSVEPEAPQEQEAAPLATGIVEVDEILADLQNLFNIDKGSAQKSVPRQTAPITVVEPPKLTSNRGNAFVGSITELLEDADTSEELLAKLLQRLVDGPFEKAALICVSNDRKQAIVIASRGAIGSGQRIALTDPLSPLAQCFSKVQSFASKPNEASPFGCKSFALAPIDADHDTPVALYADCGADGTVSFEARRIFRTVVEILNQRLPTIPGGIPVEL